MSPFDPTHLTPAISLNRVIVADLPGVDLDPALRGKNGYELVSSAALAALIRAHAGALALDPALDDHVLRLAFDARLGAGLPAAEQIACEMGRRLGVLLLALHRGDAANRAVRPEWDDSYWAHWATVRQVWLGGGLTGGRLGPWLAGCGMDVFAQAGISDYAILVSPYGSDLPLVGLARHAPPARASALVVDFGGTMIKRGIARYEGGSLVALRRLPALASGLESIYAATDGPLDRAGRLRDRMIAALAEGWALAQQAGIALCPAVMASVAAYVHQGQPDAAQRGGYVLLGLLSGNAATLLGDCLSERLGRRVAVSLHHDGSAAAAAYAGEPNAAVIMLGTALGIGFPGGGEGLLPLCPDFRMTD